MEVHLSEFLANGLLDLSWWQILLYTLVTTHITIVAVTLYLHRSMAHRSLELHPAIAHFFRFWLWLTTGMVTKEWAAIHRKHHARCEQEGDPHSPQVFGIRKVLFQGTELYRTSSKDRPAIEKFGHGTPDDWIERKLYSRYTTLGISAVLVFNVLAFGGIGLSVWAIQMLWIPWWAAGVINGLGHYVGYRNFNVTDASTNLSPVGILIGGEEMHNNHHTFPTSAKFSYKWYEFDIGWMYITILKAFGLATVKKVAPKPEFVPARPMIDGEALAAVLHHRYDVMATYARSLRQVCREEALRLSRTDPGKRKVLLSLPRWVADNQVDASRHPHMIEALAASDLVRKLVEMRAELVALWERSSVSREQLVAQLQQWCLRAEQSGVKALEDMSVRLRSYAGVRAPA